MKRKQTLKKIGQLVFSICYLWIVKKLERKELTDHYNWIFLVFIWCFLTVNIFPMNWKMHRNIFIINNKKKECHFKNVTKETEKLFKIVILSKLKFSFFHFHYFFSIWLIIHFSEIQIHDKSLQDLNSSIISFLFLLFYFLFILKEK